jgi:hypothetical protein
MPCYHTGSAEGDARLVANEARKEVTRLTRLLCAAMRAHDASTNMPASVVAWWAEHKRVDATRGEG